MRCSRCRQRKELTGRMRLRLPDKWWFPQLTFRICDDCAAEMIGLAEKSPKLRRVK